MPLDNTEQENVRALTIQWYCQYMKLLLNFKFGLNGEHEVITHFIVLTAKSIHERSMVGKKKDWHHH